MGAVIDIKSKQPVVAPGPEPLPESVRRRAEAKMALTAAVRANADGNSLAYGIDRTLAQIVGGRFEALLGDLGNMPSAATLRRWVETCEAEGIHGFVKGGRGRARLAYGWETRAQYLFAQPMRPAMATVAYWLREEGFESATNSRVRRYLKNLPSNKAETAPKRMGQHFYAQNIRPYVRRDAAVLNVGECYEGDGHTCDVYVQHPATGNPFRPELTVWLDVRSQRVTGWWLGEMENSFDVLYALSSAIREHDHVPTLLHTDPGSGYVNKMLSDEATGFYARLSISTITTLPGNARGKGLTEGWFRWFEEKLGKRFPSFCGDCRTDDDLSRLREKIRQGKTVLPTFLQYRDTVAAWIARYNARQKDALDGKSPDELWAELVRNPLGMQFEMLYRPQKKDVAVRNWGVRLFNRHYRAAGLAAHERRKVTVEYDIHDDARVWIRDSKGALVCDALLVEKKPWIAENVLADRRAHAAEGQRKRKERDLAEIAARARLPITAAAMADAIDCNDSSADEIPSMPAITDRHTMQHPPRRLLQPKPISDHARALAEELDIREEQESAEERFARALKLEATPAAEIGEEAARWLSIYRTSAEYAGRKLIHDAQEEGAGDDTPAPDRNNHEIEGDL